MIPNIRKVDYDSLKDFVPVGVVAAITWVMVVSNELPAKSVSEFVALAKSRPRKIDYSSGGNGSPQHVAMEAFKAATGIDVVHIPYRGATQAATDVMSNRVQVHLARCRSCVRYILDHRMRALGVPSTARSPLLPEVPNLCRGRRPRFEWRTWASFVVPLGTPSPIVERLARRDGQGGEFPRRARQVDCSGAGADRLAARDAHAVDAGRVEAACTTSCSARRSRRSSRGRLNRIDHVAIGVPDLRFRDRRVHAPRLSTSTKRGIATNDGGPSRAQGRGRRPEVDRARERQPRRGFGRGARARNGAVPHARRAEERPTAEPAPNGVQRIERVYIAVRDIAAAAAMYSLVLGVPKPKMERGTRHQRRHWRSSSFV